MAFSDTPQGVHSGGVVYSRIETANQLNVELYLLHVLTMPQGQVDEEITKAVSQFAPWIAQIQKRFGS